MEIKQLVVGDLETNCYLVISKNELAVIDPGGESEKILKEITEAGIRVKYIINTHYHPDHSSENLKIKNKTGAKILIHEADKAFLDFEPDQSLKEGDEIKIGEIILKVIHTPGHTKGGICLLGLQPTLHPPASQAPNILFSGDTLFKDGVGRTDLPGGSFDELEESLHKLSKILKPGMKVYPGHGEVFECKK